MSNFTSLAQELTTTLSTLRGIFSTAKNELGNSVADYNKAVARMRDARADLLDFGQVMTDAANAFDEIVDETAELTADFDFAFDGISEIVLTTNDADEDEEDADEEVDADEDEGE